MLRINTEEGHDPEVMTLRLEGELLQAWIKLEQTHPMHGVIQVDLNAVSFVDDFGKALLATLHGRGCRLIGAGAYIAVVIDECVSARPLMALGIEVKGQ